MALSDRAQRQVRSRCGRGGHWLRSISRCCGDVGLRRGLRWRRLCPISRCRGARGDYLGAVAERRVLAWAVQAYLFGSGWGERADGAKVLAEVAEDGLPAVVDADALRYLPKPAPASWLLTPHAGELATLLERDRGWVEEDPVRAVVAGAEQTGATVLLKGATQLVAVPKGGPVFVAIPGPAWTAQAGSGDVLGGVCAALLAAGVDAQRAGQLGASVQAVAAAEHPGVLAPQEMARAIGRTLGRLEQRARLR